MDSKRQYLPPAGRQAIDGLQDMLLADVIGRWTESKTEIEESQSNLTGITPSLAKEPQPVVG